MSSKNGGDLALISIFDEVYSDQDVMCRITMGMLKKGQLCVVIHTEHDSADETLIRIISAHPATPDEKKQYNSSREDHFRLGREEGFLSLLEDS